MTAAVASMGPVAYANPVSVENAMPGSPGWRGALAPGRAVEAYGSAISVAPGDELALHVSTVPAAPYRVEVYRLGWYGGAGARLMACLPGCGSHEQGAARAVPAGDPTTGLLRADWPVTDRLTVGSDWVSGEYLARVTLTTGPAAGTGRFVPFVVRAPAGRDSRILAQVPVNTWEAYNDWGGKSLYDFNSTQGRAAVKVSFDRPWAIDDLNVSFPVLRDYTALRYLERQGYDVSYTTDVDTHRDPGELLRHRLVMSIGHDEYWTKEMRDAFDAARDGGHDLAFLGANSAFWQLRYEDGERTLVEYRSRAADPGTDEASKTTKFRLLVPPRPECELLGVQFQQGGLTEPLVNDYVVREASLGDPWFAGTGLRAGDVLPGAVAGEWDALQDGCDVPAPTVFFEYTGSHPAQVTRYLAPSGARVLAVGSLGFASLLDGWARSPCSTDPRAERFMRNALDDLAGQEARPGGPMPDACPAAPAPPPPLPPPAASPVPAPCGSRPSPGRARTRSHHRHISFSGVESVSVVRAATTWKVTRRRVVARPRVRHGRATWAGRGPDGTYILRVRAANGTRRLVVDRRHGRFRFRPAFASRGCGALRTARLSAPAFGGTTHRPLRATVHAEHGAHSVIELRRGGKVLRRAAGRELTRMRVPPHGLEHGVYIVRVHSWRGRHSERATLSVRNL